MLTLERWPRLGSSALDICEQIGRGYHRTETDDRVKHVRNILLRLAGVMTDLKSASLTPVEQVHQAGVSSCYKLHGRP